MSSLYYSPEKFGLSVVGEADAGGGYDFDKFVVWRRNYDGAILWAEDSGCSCPSPFEDESVDTLKVGSVRDAINDLEVWVGDRDGYRYSDRRYAADQLRAVLEAIA